MKTLTELTPNTQIFIKNHIISIGVDPTDIAIISKTTGNFIQFKDIKKGSRLKTIKRLFKHKLCSDNDMCFSFMRLEDVNKILSILN